MLGKTIRGCHLGQPSCCRQPERVIHSDDGDIDYYSKQKGPANNDHPCSLKTGALKVPRYSHTQI